MRKQPRWIFVWLGITLLSGCASNREPQAWSSFFPADEPGPTLSTYWQVRGLPLSGEVRWNHDAQGRLFLSDRDGYLHGLSLPHKTTPLVLKTRQPWSSAPWCDAGVCWLGDVHGQLIGLDPTGHVRMRHALPGVLLAPPVALGDQALALFTQDNTIMRWSPQEGTIWQATHPAPALTLYGNATPVRHGSHLLVGLSDGRLLCLDAQTGTERWSQPVGHPEGRHDLQRMVDIMASPVIAGDRVFATSHQSSTVALDLKTGEELWRTPVGSLHAPAHTEAAVFVVDDHDVIHALNPEFGTQLWTQDVAKGRHLSAPMVLGGHLYVLDEDAHLLALSPATGDLLSCTRLGSQGEGAPMTTVVQGRFMVAYWPLVGRLTVYHPDEQTTRLGLGGPT